MSSPAGEQVWAQPADDHPNRTPPPEARRSIAFPLIMALSVSLGVAMVVLVKPGVPSDEPSHWLNVLYYVHHHAMPTTGDPSVTYEAQQPPLAYIVAAFVEGAVRAAASLKGAFFATRILGGIEWLIALVFAWRLLGHLLPDRPCGRVVGFAVLALNPMLAAMAWSVQNDSLALLVGFAALDFASTVGRRNVHPAQSAVLGAIVAAGVLTKLTDWALVVAIPLWLLAVPRGRRPWKAVLAFGGSLVVLSGWWFIRNAALYGDPLGPRKAAAAGFGLGPFPLTGVGSLGHAAENVVTYLWLPTEYWRSLVHAPAPLKGLLALLSAAILAVGVFAGFRKTHLRPATEPSSSVVDQRCPDTWSLVTITGVIAFVAWLLVFFGLSATAPRLAYLALPLWAGLVGLAAEFIGELLPRLRPSLPVVTVAFMLALGVWSLHAVHVAPIPYHFIDNV